MKIGMIYAKAQNNVIGKNGDLPWYLPEDLAHFKKITQGHPVIMGRKTWDSLPAKFKPLPGRQNIVVSRASSEELKAITQTGAWVCNSLELALEKCRTMQTSPTEIWIIGGAQIYQQAQALCNAAEVTLIEQDFEGDAFAPVLDGQWLLQSEAKHQTQNGLNYRFLSYVRSASLS